MEEKNISTEESLQIIEKMLADTRNRFYNNGFAFLFWGAWIILALIVDYFATDFLHKNYSAYIWIISIVVGMLFTIIYYSVAVPRKRTFSKLDSINGKLWTGFGVAFMVLMFLCYQYKIDSPPFIYCFTGLCMFASGGIYKFWSLYAGAIVFWVGAVAWVLFKNEIDLWLLSIGVMFFGYLVPGYLLWKKAKQEAHV